MPQERDASPAPETLRDLLGCAPAPDPLDLTELEAIEAADHGRALVEYGTAMGERVRAWLLRPRHAKGPTPGIVAIHQDGERRPYAVGKSEPAGLGGDPELAYGLELCRRGYTVLCPDRFPFESRSLARSRHRASFEAFSVHARYGGEELDVTEDLYLGCVSTSLLVRGWSLVGRTLFELQRAVDVLTGLPDVDPGRLGAIGHSAGGFYAALLMYLDPRIGAGCSSCGTFLLRWVLGGEALKPITGFGALAIPGFLRWGDLDQVLAGLAPRPFLETEGEQGMPSGMREAKYALARARYTALGVPERFETVAYPGSHAFRRDMRQRSYAWLDRWLSTPKGERGAQT